MKKCMHEYGNHMLALQPARPPQESHLTSLGLRFSAVNILVVKSINAFGTVQGILYSWSLPRSSPSVSSSLGPPGKPRSSVFKREKVGASPHWLRAWALLLVPAKPALGPASSNHTHTLVLA